MEPDKAVTYSGYLALDRLLNLQHRRSDPSEHDEMLFIIIHQVYELWFKQLLHEFDKVKADFSSDNLFGAIGTLKRVRMMLKTLVGQLDILETMTPLSFMSFRDRLESASGFQSSQFREVEFVLGYKRPEMVVHFPEGSTERARLERRLNGRSLVDHFHDFLETQGVTIPEAIRDKPVTQPTLPDAKIQKEILRLYRSRPEIAILVELLVDIDEGFQEWRYRHVKMVERTIGNKPGTGGSSGVEFLKRTLFKPFFPDLWAIRHEF
jgi:tryptophan 2,3-dioxygenase